MEGTLQRENQVIKIDISYGYKTMEWSLGTPYLLFDYQNQHTIYTFFPSVQFKQRNEGMFYATVPLR